MKKPQKLLFGGLIIVFTLFIASGIGSLAYFSDTETSTGNTFTAGTLDLKVWDTGTNDWVDDPYTPTVISSGYWNSAIGSLINNMKPGDEGTITVPIRNDGSVDGIARIQIVDLEDYENGLTEPESEVDITGSELEGELSRCLDLVIYYGGEQKATGTLHSLAGNVIELGDLVAYGEEDVVMIFSIDYDSVGNEIQSDSVEFDIVFGLIQPEP